MISDARRRMNALSSTTSTRGRLDDIRALPKRSHFDAPVVDVQVDAPSVIASGVRGNDRNLRGREHVADGEHVPLADVHRTVRDEIGEHARATNDFRAKPLLRRTEASHLLYEDRN